MQSSEVAGADLYHTTIGKVVLGNHGWDFKDISSRWFVESWNFRFFQKIAQLLHVEGLWNAFWDDAYTPEI